MHYIPNEPALAHVGGNTIGGNPQTFYPELWKWLVQKLGIKSVLDVGCGEGHAILEFNRLGCIACGFDGAKRNVELVPSDSAWVHDLTKGPCLGQPNNLTWCCEVVGQIDIQYIDNVCKTLSLGKYLAMTNELPGQPGHHHVNLRPTEFWEGILYAYGMEVDQQLTEESKKYAGFYWARTGRIYRRRIKP